MGSRETTSERLVVRLPSSPASGFRARDVSEGRLSGAGGVVKSEGIFGAGVWASRREGWGCGWGGWGLVWGGRICEASDGTEMDRLRYV